jgi:hypothetical protein
MNIKQQTKPFLAVRAGGEQIAVALPFNENAAIKAGAGSDDGSCKD